MCLAGVSTYHGAPRAPTRVSLSIHGLRRAHRERHELRGQQVDAALDSADPRGALINVLSQGDRRQGGFGADALGADVVAEERAQCAFWVLVRTVFQWHAKNFNLRAHFDFHLTILFYIRPC